MADISKTGVWIDLKTNEVVESEPEEGVQLVPPGGELTPSVQEDIERAKAAASGEVTPVETVTTESVSRAPKKSAKKDE